jgi:type II secretory pathway pseudopilin PulG
MLKCLNAKILEWQGFTLVELLVSIFIIILISGIIFANYRVGGQQFALQRSANKLAQDIRRAQAMAMGAAEYAGCPAGYKYGYGIYLTTSTNNKYILFADCDNGKDYDSPGEAVGDPIPLEAGVKIKTLSPSSPLTITFTPPDPTITISPSAPATITLGNDSQTKTITVNSAGLIEIQ